MRTTIEKEPIILGALHRSVIDDVIKGHLSQLKDCYQRVLAQRPHAAGKLVIKFTIAFDGAVSAATVKSTTLNEPEVERCVTRHFMDMEFPQPKGGGVIMVTYPFLFSPG